MFLVVQEGEQMESEKVQKEYFVWDIRKRADVENRYVLFLVLEFGLGIVFLLLSSMIIPWIAELPWIVGHEKGFEMNQLSGDMGRADVLLTQISITFIVISLTTILSSNSKAIYWTDMVELTLVKPIFVSFKAFSAYIFACLAWSSVCVLIKSDKVYIGFWSSILIMTFFTFRLIRIYFGNNKIKKEAKVYFEWMRMKDKEEYLIAQQKMIHVMSKNIMENDFSEFYVNFDFLCMEKEDVILSQVIQICGTHNEVLLENLVIRLRSAFMSPQNTKYLILKNDRIKQVFTLMIRDESKSIHMKEDIQRLLRLLKEQ